MRDTIFAPATASGRAAVAVVRISGPDTARVVLKLCRSLPAPRQAALRRLAMNGEMLDEALVLWMPGPASFTGEDTAELQIHGGPAVVGAVCQALSQASARFAEAGEFTRRAFEAGRLDLTQAEAIADLVDAETEGQRRQATAQFSGALADRYRKWRESLLDALAMIEAGIDFPEDDVPDGVVDGAIPAIEAVRAEIAQELDQARGERVRSGVTVAIVGEPNVGKSTILNALAGRDAAIVTEVAGTTRDPIEVHLELCGQAVLLVDTAGLRATDEVVEAEGVSRARRWIDRADIRLVVGDATRPDTLAKAESLIADGDILVVNKVDLATTFQFENPPDPVWVSANHDIQPVRDALAVRIAALSGGQSFPAITRQRHRTLLESCRGHLTQAVRDRRVGAELVGESARLALRDLGWIDGRSDPGAILDRVFSKFCIGK